MSKTSEDVDFRLIRILAGGKPDNASLEIPADLSPILQHTRELYDRIGWQEPWISYLAVQAGVIVGGGAFVGPPRDGAVEIAYFTLPDHERQGFAGRTAATLVALARAAVPEIILWAKTLPEENASTHILSRLGFHREGFVEDHEIGTAWLWRLNSAARFRA